MKSRVWCLLLGVLLVTGHLAVQAAQFGDFSYESSGTAVTITGYDCRDGAVTIPDTIQWVPVTGIGMGAFHSCSGLTSIRIPESVTSIGMGAFSGCTGLTAITVGALNPAYSSQDGVLFSKNQATLIRCPGGRAGSYSISESVTRIEYAAFRGCTGLTSVAIPDSVFDIGAGAFSGCTGLTTVTIPGSVIRSGGFPFVPEEGWGGRSPAAPA